MSINEPTLARTKATDHNWWDAVIPVVVDVLTLSLLATLPLLSPWLVQGNPLNAAVIIPIFIIFWLSVFMIKRLETVPQAAKQRVWLPDWLFATQVQVGLGILFALAFVTALAHQIGYFDSIFLVDNRELGAGESSSFFVMIPGTWLAMALLYVLPLASSPRDWLPRISRWYYPALFLSLLGVNLMLLTAVAELYTLHHYIFESSGSNLLWFISSLLLLTLLFAPPRFWYWWKAPNYTSLISWVALLLGASSFIAFSS